MKDTLILVILLLLYPFILAQSGRTLEDVDEMAKRIRPNIVQVEVDGNYGYGFVINEEPDSLYVITAYHVLNPSGDPVIDHNGLNINVSIFKQVVTVPASICYYSNQRSSDRVNDIAVLQLVKPQGYQSEPNCLASHCSLETGIETFVVKDWQVPIQNKKTKIDSEWGQIRDFNKPIIAMDWNGLIIGYSGGPVFNECGIIGMMKEARQGQADVLNIFEIIDWMNMKNQLVDHILYTPVDFTLKPSLGYQKFTQEWTWILLSSATAVGVSGFLLCISGKTDYHNYKTHRFEKDHIYVEFTRDELYQRANRKHKLAQGMLIGTGTIVTAALLGNTKLFKTEICKEMPNSNGQRHSFLRYSPDFIAPLPNSTHFQTGSYGFSVSLHF